MFKEDMSGVTLTNAYGRNPKTEQAVLELWYKGKDFIINCPNHRWSGSYCSIRDTKPGDAIKLRYNSNEDAVSIICAEGVD